MTTTTQTVSNPSSYSFPAALAVVMLLLAGQAASAQGLQLERNSNEVANGSVDVLPQLVAESDSRDVTYAISNVGPGTLTLTGDPLVEIVASTNVDTFILSQPSVASLATNATTSFTLFLAPLAEGPFNIQLRIQHDGVGAPFQFTLAGSASLAPRLTLFDSVQREVLPGDSHQVGYLRARFAQSLTYTIENRGSTELLLLEPPVVLSELDNATAQVSQPTTLVVSAGQQASFTVLIEPEFSGPFSYRLDVRSNDPLHPVITTRAYGSSTTIPQSRPVLERPGAREIPHRGTHEVGRLSSTHIYTFAVRNVGSEPLLLDEISVRAERNATVALTQPGQSELDYGESSTFTAAVSFEETGEFSFRLHVKNDSPMLPGYWAQITGEAQAVAQPALLVERAPNDSVVAGGEDHLSGTRQAGVGFTVVYWLRNVGNDTLDVEWPVEVAQQENVVATVLRLPAREVSAFEGLTPLVLEVTPVAAGPFQFEVQIGSSDPEQAQYAFTVHGNAPQQAISSPSKYLGGCAASHAGNADGAHLPVLVLLVVVVAALLRRRHREVRLEVATT